MANPADYAPNKPTTRTIDWTALVRKAWGDDYLKKEIVYEFSDGKKYQSTDSSTSGFYTG
jgi:hypothetical protein